MKKMDKKTPIKILNFIIFFLIAILLMQLYTYSGSMGYIKGEAHARGPEEMCDKMNGAMDQSGYCLIGEPTGEYRHYIDCSWAKIIVTGEYEDEDINLDPRMWYTQCKRVGQEVNNYHDMVTYIVEG